MEYIDESVELTTVNEQISQSFNKFLIEQKEESTKMKGSHESAPGNLHLQTPTSSFVQSNDLGNGEKYENLVNDLEERLNSTEHELFNALENESRLKENVHELQNKISELQTQREVARKLRRYSNQTLLSYQQILKEFRELKEQNATLKVESNEMKATAIEVLVEKEQIIIELRKKLEETELFYREQLDTCLNEIRSLHEKLEFLEQSQRTAINEREADIILHEKNEDLRRRFLIITEELERKEKELQDLKNDMHIIISEKVQEKLLEYISTQRINENKLIRDTIEEMEDRDEFLRRNEKERMCLLVKIADLEEKYERELTDYRQKLEDLRVNNEQEVLRLNQNYERQKAKSEKNWNDIMDKKNEYIREIEQNREMLIKRVNSLEAENRNLFKIGAELRDKYEKSESSKTVLESKIKDVMKKHEQKITKLEQKMLTEKKFHNMQVRSMKEDRNSEEDERLNRRNTANIETLSILKKKGTLEGEIGQALAQMEYGRYGSIEGANFALTNSLEEKIRKISGDEKKSINEESIETDSNSSDSEESPSELSEEHLEDDRKHDPEVTKATIIDVLENSSYSPPESKNEDYGNGVQRAGEIIVPIEQKGTVDEEVSIKPQPYKEDEFRPAVQVSENNRREAQEQEKQQYTPENKPHVPENKPYVPEKPYTPENKPYVPENKPYISENKPYVPENKPYVPETKLYVPVNRPYDKEDKPYVPENNAYAPDVPENKPYVPENNAYVPENKPFAPENKAYVPENMPYIPGNTPIEEKPLREGSTGNNRSYVVEPFKNEGDCPNSIKKNGESLQLNTSSTVGEKAMLEPLVKDMHVKKEPLKNSMFAEKEPLIKTENSTSSAIFDVVTKNIVEQTDIYQLKNENETLKREIMSLKTELYQKDRLKSIRRKGEVQKSGLDRNIEKKMTNSLIEGMEQNTRFLRTPEKSSNKNKEDMGSSFKSEIDASKELGSTVEATNKKKTSIKRIKKEEVDNQMQVSIESSQIIQRVSSEDSKLELEPKFDRLSSEIEVAKETTFSTKTIYMKSLSAAINEIKRGIRDVERGQANFVQGQNRLKQILEKMSLILGTMHDQYKTITSELLKKTVSKFESKTVATLRPFNLIQFTIKNYVFKEDRHAEYTIEIEDKLIDKQWSFTVRYFILRELHQSLRAAGKMLKNSGHTNIVVPPFPPRKLFGNLHPEFLEARKDDLNRFFSTLFFNPICKDILDSGIVKGFLKSMIWTQTEQEINKLQKNIMKWDDFERLHLLKPVTTGSKIENIRGTVVEGLQKELEKISELYEQIGHNIELLDQNDTIWIMHYEEKRKRTSLK